MREIDDFYDLMDGRKSWDDLDGYMIADRDIGKAYNNAVKQDPNDIPSDLYPLEQGSDPLAAVMQVKSPFEEGGSLNPKKENVIHITADAIQPPTGPLMPTELAPEDRIPKYAENFRTNVNPVLKRQLQTMDTLDEEKANRQNDVVSTRQELLDAVRRAGSNPKPFKSNYDYAGEMARMQDQQAKVDTPEQRDMLSELIYNFGAPVLGALTGETGEISQLPAQKSIDAQRLEDRKLAANSKQKLSNEISKRMIGLSKMKEGEFNQYKDEIKMEQDRLGKLADRLAKMNDNDLKGRREVEQDLMKSEENFSKDVIGSAKDLAKFEEAKALSDDRNAAGIQKAKAGGQKQEKDKTFERSLALRKEYQARPEVKKFTEMERSYNQMKQVASKSPTAAGDISLIFNFMRMNDPTSTVREGEYATAQNAAGVPDIVRNQYNKLVDGQRLSPKQRLDFVKTANNLYSSAIPNINRIKRETQANASKFGIPSDLVVGEQKQIQPTQVGYKDGDEKTIAGQVYKRKGGKWLPK